MKRNKDDGIIDGVAVNRALSGDRGVYKALRPAELRVMWLESAKRSKAAGFTLIPRDTSGRDGGARYMSEYDINLADNLGLSKMDVRQYHFRALKRASE